MPGVLLIEGMAQTAGALCVHADAIGTPKLVYFMTINNAKFRKPVLPGDRVEFHMRKTAQKRTMWWYKGVAKVDGVVVCEAEVSAMLIADTAKPTMNDGPTARIHPSAIVEPGATARSRRRDRPFLPRQRFAVTLGARVVALVSHVVIAGETTIGARTRIYPFASIGHAPQDLKYRGEPTTLSVGRGLHDPRRRHHQSGHQARRFEDGGGRSLRAAR